MRLKNKLLIVSISSLLGLAPLLTSAQSKEDVAVIQPQAPAGYHLSAAPMVEQIPLSDPHNATFKPKIIGYYLLADQKPVVTTAKTYAYGQEVYESVNVPEAQALDKLFRVISPESYEPANTFYELVEIMGPSDNPILKPVIIVKYSAVGLQTGAAPNFVGRTIVNKQDLAKVRGNLDAVNDRDPYKKLIRIKHGNHVYDATEINSSKLMVGDQIGVSQKNPTKPVKS